LNADDSPKSSSILLSSSFSNAKLSDLDLASAPSTPAESDNNHHYTHHHYSALAHQNGKELEKENNAEEEENNKNNKNLCSLNGNSTTVSIFSSSPSYCSVTTPATATSILPKCYKNNISIQIDDKNKRIINLSDNSCITKTPINEANTMKTTSVVIFPDAPTTPKVIRKCSPDATATHKVSCEFMPATTRNLKDLIVAGGENIVTVNENPEQNNSITILLSSSSTSLNSSSPSSSASASCVATSCNNNLFKNSVRTSNVSIFPTNRQPTITTTTISSNSTIHLIDVDLDKLNSS
jgi:delta 1-pyrroline-5-carboxylate dehydrogenase